MNYWYGNNTDLFENKISNIVGLGISPPENAFILNVSVKKQKQSLNCRQPLLPTKTGQLKKSTSTYHPNETVTLPAALSVHKLDITANNVNQNEAQASLSLFKELYRKYPCKQLQVIIDTSPSSLY